MVRIFGQACRTGGFPCKGELDGSTCRRVYERAQRPSDSRVRGRPLLEMWRHGACTFGAQEEANLYSLTSDQQHLRQVGDVSHGLVVSGANFL